MKRKTIFSLIIFFLICLIFFLFKGLNNKKTQKIEADISNDVSYHSNIIKDVYYSSKDIRGNEYIIKASEGEIDFSNPNIIYLTNVNSHVKLVNSNDIKIKSDFGKYNSENFDTIFSKNVIIDYLDNNILGEYLDFSITRSSMLMSRDVIYTNSNNILKADNIEIDIETKNTKIYMFQNDKKVNIRSKQ
ncbi:hypothetical protein OAS16_03785 [Candidatus Pelagibacter sp.]|nr:hypothetical protein [Candidatus Pelagibacter sp.]